MTEHVVLENGRDVNPSPRRQVTWRHARGHTYPVAVDRSTFFQIMSAFPTGVAIVTTVEEDGTPRGLTTNAVTSVSADPPILLVCVDKDSRTLPALRASRRFVVNFMRDDHAEICALFASKADNKFAIGGMDARARRRSDPPRGSGRAC